MSNLSIANITTAIAFDGTTGEEASGGTIPNNSYASVLAMASERSGLSEAANHYATLLGAVNAGTGKWFSSTTNAQGKVQLIVSVNG
jgi:hypothetical protein